MVKIFVKICLLIIVGFCSILPAQTADLLVTQKFKPRIQSLAIPGWGEKTLNRHGRARFFMGSEIMLWVSLAGSYLNSNLFEQKMIAYATEHASVQGSGKETQFWIDIGNYDSREAYNAEHLRWRDYETLYPAGPTWNWDWDSDRHRSRFESLRIRRDQWSLASKFLLGGLLLNRVVSAIDVMYLQRIRQVKGVSVFPSYNASFASLGITLSISL